jgi:hypothetical protein
MKSTFPVLLLVLLMIAGPARAQQSTLVTVESHGTRGTRLNMVFLSEGYTSAEMGKFATDVQDAVDFLFTKEPWDRYRSYCNIFRIEIASNQSGTDNGSAGGMRDTYFHTGFNTPGIPQLNTISSTGSTRAYTLLNQHVPEYHIPIILINDDQYGGSGGPLALATTHSLSAAILEHELGHSFAKLTDEYDENYPGYPAIEYPNATAKSQRAQVRWNVWIDSGTPVPTPENQPAYADPVVGLFEGANYRSTGWYRPHDDALMRNLNRPPGYVSREAILLTYYTKVSPIDARTPLSLTQTVTTRIPLAFGVTVKVPSTPPALSIRWLVDGVEQTGETGPTFTIASTTLGNGTHRVKAIVRDPTDWVRRDPSALTTEEVTWTLQLSNQVDPPEIDTPLPTETVRELGSTLTLDATASGPAPITYQWLKNNAPMVPARLGPVLTLQNLSLADAATYTVRVTNPARTITASTRVAVLNPVMPTMVVAGAGRTATLAFVASPNLPAVSWRKVGSLNALANGTRYAGASTKSLLIKNIVPEDSGDYEFICGDYGPSLPVELRVVTARPDFTGFTPVLDVGIVGAAYDDTLPVPPGLTRTPDSFSAALPAGLRLNAKTGRITGTPTVASRDQVQGDEVTFTVGNILGRVPVKVRLLIKPLPPGVAGVFTGIIHRGSPLGGPTGGRIDFTVLSTGAYTGRAIIGQDTLPFTGFVSVADILAHTASFSLSLKPRHLPSALAIPLTIDEDGDSDPTTAGVNGAPNLQAWRNKWLPPESIDPFKGYYTFGLRVPTEPGNLPRGHGYGSITVLATGATTAAGRLADGEAFTTSSHLSRLGEALIYQTLYTTATRGSVLGTLSLPGPAPLSIVGSLGWQRPPADPARQRVYAGGFGPISLDAFGRLYTPPGPTTIPMELPAATGNPATNARLAFDTTLGDDPLPVTADVTLAMRAGGGVKINAPNPKNTSLSLTPATGAFRGSYTTRDTDPRPPSTRPPVTRTVSYQGMIVNDDGMLSGFGFFLRDALPKSDGSTTPTNSPKHSGKVRLTPHTP